MQNLRQTVSCTARFAAVILLAGLAGGCPYSLPPPGNSITILNDTAYPIVVFYVTSSSSGSWGRNQLPSPLGPGESFTVFDIPRGIYDLRARVSTPRGLEDIYRLDVVFRDGDDLHWTVHSDVQYKDDGFSIEQFTDGLTAQEEPEGESSAIEGRSVYQQPSYPYP